MSCPARYIRICNLLTYVSLSCSLMAVFAAREYGSWETAGLLLAVSALADTFDGKFARLFPRNENEKAFGAQLDSLVDTVAFGIAPVICLESLVQFQSTSARAAWLAAAFVYVLCAVTRLGFYNIHNHVESGFIGLPTTLAALLWSTLFLTHPTVTSAALILAVLGVAMVSPLPIARPRGIAMGAYMLWFLVVFASYALRLAGGIY
jgi:CDP-diacylglycerol---serine O-phosphatidyltransferase